MQRAYNTKGDSYAPCRSHLLQEIQQFVLVQNQLSISVYVRFFYDFAQIWYYHLGVMTPANPHMPFCSRMVHAHYCTVYRAILVLVSLAYPLTRPS